MTKKKKLICKNCGHELWLPNRKGREWGWVLALATKHQSLKW